MAEQTTTTTTTTEPTTAQQTTSATVDYDKIQKMLDGTLAAKEDTALKAYFKQQGLSQEEAEQAISAFKQQKAASQPDVGALQQQAQAAQKAAQDAQIQAVHSSIDSIRGINDNRPLDPLCFLHNFVHAWGNIQDSTFLRNSSLIHVCHHFVKQPQEIRCIHNGLVDGTGIIVCQFSMQLGKSVAVLFRDSLLSLKSVLDVSHGEGKVGLVNIHRVNPNLNVSVMGQLFSLPVVGQGSCIESRSARVILITRYGHPRQLDGLCIDELNLRVTFGQRIGTQFLCVFLLQ